MMGSTDFRGGLIDTLRKMADAAALAEFQAKHPFLEAREEMWTHFVSYYTGELLRYPPSRRSLPLRIWIRFSPPWRRYVSSTTLAGSKSHW